MKNQKISILVLAILVTIPNLATAQIEAIKDSLSADLSLQFDNANPLFAPRGIFGLVPWGKDPQKETWEDPCLDGVTIRRYWFEFNPRPGVYDWEDLKILFAQAEHYDKKIQLIIAPGFYAPQWVLNRLDEAEKVPFYVPHGDYKREERPLPLPWSTAYLNHWFTFIDALAAAFGSHPALSLINITGPNGHNGEVNLPDKDKEGNSTEERWKDIVLPDWQAVEDGAAKAEKKLKNKMIQAYELTIDRFYEAFDKEHGKYLSLQIFNGSLPIADVKHKPSPLQLAYADELVKIALAKLGKNFVLMNGGLEAWPLADVVSTRFPPPEKPPQWERIQRLADLGFVTGLMQKDQVDGGDVEKSGVSEQVLFRQIVRNSIRFGAGFLVLFEKDIHDEKFKGLISAGGILLNGKCRCT